MLWSWLSLFDLCFVVSACFVHQNVILSWETFYFDTRGNIQTSTLLIYLERDIKVWRMFELKQLNVVVDYSVGWVSATNINICHLGSDPDSALLHTEKSGLWLQRIAPPPEPLSRSKDGTLGVKTIPSPLRRSVQKSNHFSDKSIPGVSGSATGLSMMGWLSWPVLLLVTMLGRHLARLQCPSQSPSTRPRMVNTEVRSITRPVPGPCSLRGDDGLSGASPLVRKMTFLTRNSPDADGDSWILIWVPTVHMSESMTSSSQLDTTWLQSIVSLMSISPGPVLITWILLQYYFWKVNFV